MINDIIESTSINDSDAFSRSLAGYMLGEFIGKDFNHVFLDDGDFNKLFSPKLIENRMSGEDAPLIAGHGSESALISLASKGNLDKNAYLLMLWNQWEPEVAYATSKTLDMSVDYFKKDKKTPYESCLSGSEKYNILAPRGTSTHDGLMRVIGFYPYIDFNSDVYTQIKNFINITQKDDETIVAACLYVAVLRSSIENNSLNFEKIDEYVPTHFKNLSEVIIGKIISADNAYDVIDPFGGSMSAAMTSLVSVKNTMNKSLIGIEAFYHTLRGALEYGRSASVNAALASSIISSLDTTIVPEIYKNIEIHAPLDVKSQEVWNIARWF